MKKILSKLLGVVLLLSLSMSLTSCDDILGEWSRPTPTPVTPGGGSEGGGSSTIAVTSVKLDETNLRYLKTELTAQTLTATVSPADATDKSVTWTSSDENVATVDASGKVTPKAKGIATITATTTDGGKKATCTVNIYDGVWNINAQAAPTVPADEFWLISGNGTAEAKSITIGNGAMVTLNGINVTQQIECSGTATIILADDSENKVTVSTDELAGIQIGGTGTTLTINAETAGTGTLTATGGRYGAGIGTGFVNVGTKICGTITINGGTVTATGGGYGAGIGTGMAIPPSDGTASNECGAITINGGTVTATGGQEAAGIGTGLSAQFSGGTASNKCGAIMIGTGVISVTAKKSDSNPGPRSIGKGFTRNGGTQTCGTITIGGTIYWNGSDYQNGGETYLVNNITYPTAP